MSFIVKNTTFPGLFDLLAPHSCRGCGRIGETLCECCKKNIISNHINICPNCKSPNLAGKCAVCNNLPPAFIAGKRNELIGKLIYDLKFYSVHALAKPLAEIINAKLPNIDGKVIVVPLPTINRHIHERGLDHTLLIAKNLSKLRQNWETKPQIIRINNTVQIGSSKAQRQIQAAQAYNLNQRIPIDTAVTYILLDDVWTTGASMHSAIEKLRQAGVEKIILAILALS